MSNLKATVVMKTDLAGFTGKVSQSSQSDLASLLNTHKEIISDVVSKNNGNIIKGEGDSFWITFQSVTIAAISAIEIQQEFVYTQAGLSDKETLKIRIAITIGDILHKDADIFGDTVNLTARIESITPPNEIYLSHAACLVLNKAEISNSYVGEFSLKGINEKEKVFKIDQKHKTRIIKDQIVAFTDTRKFTYFKENYSMEDVEILLTEMENTAKEACELYGGTIRATIGDSHFITFTDPADAIRGIIMILESWNNFLQEKKYPCYTTAGMHRADVYIFRSCIYGDQINKAAMLQSLCESLDPEATRNIALISEEIYNDIKMTDIATKIKMVKPEKLKTHLMKRINHQFEQGENIYEIIL